MTHTVRAELAKAVRRRYQAVTGKQKRRVLDEFTSSSGYHEKSAIRVLNASRTMTAQRTRNRPSIYDEAARTALISYGKPPTSMVSHVSDLGQKKMRVVARWLEARGYQTALIERRSDEAQRAQSVQWQL